MKGNKSPGTMKTALFTLHIAVNLNPLESMKVGESIILQTARYYAVYVLLIFQGRSLTLLQIYLFLHNVRLEITLNSSNLSELD